MNPSNELPSVGSLTDNYLALARTAKLSLLETIFLASPTWGMRSQRTALANRKYWLGTPSAWDNHFQLSTVDDNQRSRFIFDSLMKLGYPDTSNCSIEIAHKTLLASLFTKLRVCGLPESWFVNALNGQFEIYAELIVLEDFQINHQLDNSHILELQHEYSNLSSALIALTLDSEFTAAKNVKARMKTVSSNLAGFGIDAEMLEPTLKFVLTKEKLKYYKQMKRDSGFFSTDDDLSITQLEQLFPEFKAIINNCKLKSFEQAPEQASEQLIEQSLEQSTELIARVNAYNLAISNQSLSILPVPVITEHLQPRDAADALGISYQRMLDYLKAEEPAFAFRVGRAWKVNRKMFFEWLEGHHPQIPRYIESIPTPEIAPVDPVGRFRRF